jgi:Nif-specific regulatory protein
MELSELTSVDRPAGTSSFLVVHRGPARLEVVELFPGSRLTIGRSPTNRVVIPDPKCSRQHCEVYGRESRWFLRDLDSRNGVSVDGQRVTGDWELVNGQTIALGACDILYTHTHPDRAPLTEIGAPEDPYAIIERKAGTQYDRPLPSHGGTGAAELFQLARTMSAANDTAALADCALDGLMRGTPSSLGGILLFPFGRESTDPAELKLMAVRATDAATTPSFSQYLSGMVLREREALLAHDVADDSTLRQRESITLNSAKSAICAPIRTGQTVAGVIHLYSQSAGTPLDGAGLEFTLAVADQFGSVLKAVVEKEQLAAGLSRVESQFQELQVQLEVETELVGRSPLLDKVRKSIARVAPTDATVLIRGESGVGKELVARAVHYNSPRKTGPFVCVNCAALTESLLESELFGHEKGAFTGAAGQKQGKFEQAHHGTLFLDEIGEMSPDIQAKFLRVLEGSAFERVGGAKEITVDVRVVAATNRDLEQAVRENKFRQDLFFRLQVIEVHVPSLREHPEDIASIVDHFVERFSRKSRIRVQGFNREAMDMLRRHRWPGNVRELRNVVERAIILTDHAVLTPADVVLSRIEAPALTAQPTFVPAPRSATDSTAERPTEPGGRRAGPITPPPDARPSWLALAEQGMTLDEVDRLYLEAVLDHCRWNKSNAARLLGIERTTLDRRVKRYGLEKPPKEID